MQGAENCFYRAKKRLSLVVILDHMLGLTHMSIIHRRYMLSLAQNLESLLELCGEESDTRELVSLAFKEDINGENVKTAILSALSSVAK